MAYTTVAIAAYFLGSIPTGYLAGKARGIDVRSSGSGNIGATNVFRTVGKRAGILVLTIDFLKGYLAATAVPKLGIAAFLPGASPQFHELLSIIAGVAAVLGHNYTCWLHFKGGKGIATSAGVVLAWVPAALLVVAALWLIVLAVTRFVSLASISAALLLPVAVWVTRSSPRMFQIAVVLSVLAIYKHRANIQRLCKGTEHRLGSKHSPRPSRSTS
jgi:acyl phosphate:glycerol-3-phosphate acyltransferase